MKELKKYHKIKSKFIETDSLEEQFKVNMNRALNDAKRQVIDNIKTSTSKSIQKAINPEDAAKFSLGSLARRLWAIALKAAQKGLERSYKDMNVSLAWTIDMTPIANFYREHYKQFTNLLSTDIQDQIREIIAVGVERGATTEEVAGEVANFFDAPINVPAKLDEEGKIVRSAYQIDRDTYSTMVARTETQRALNNGRIYGYQQSNIAKTVRWLANPGACELCEPRNGEIFEVTESIDLIPLHPNCRCTWIVDTYKDYDEEVTGQDKFAEPSKIYSDPNGVGITEFFKLSDVDHDRVIKLIDNGKESEALKILRGMK